jgi:hypothetical protein
MKWKLPRSLVVVGLLFTAVLAIGAQGPIGPITVPLPSIISPIGLPEPTNLPPMNPVSTPLNLIGVIPIPGNPVVSTDITWVDQLRGRAYLTDRSNFGVDIFDAVNDTYVGRVTGFVGPSGVVGTGGPNGVIVTEDNQMWVGDGNDLVQVVDLNQDPPTINHTISIGPVGDSRADELGYDPLERVILIATPGAKPSPYATFISADSYQVLGKITFADASGLEQPIWDSQLHKFLLTVPVGGGTSSYIAVIDVNKMTVDKKYQLGNCGATGLVLGPAQRLATSCGKPIILNPIDGHILSTIQQVNGGDQIWYNGGDGRVYVTGADSTGQQSLGVIDINSATWLQNVPVTRGKNPTAYEVNNHVFVTVTTPAATAADTTLCAANGLDHKGCMAVYSH